MRQMTFKEYLESKERLREAVENTPICTTSYEINKYCRLVVGESKTTKEILSLKPKSTIIVEWEYFDLENPTPLSIKIEGIKTIDPFSEIQTFWSGKKLNKWLLRNTKEI